MNLLRLYIFVQVALLSVLMFDHSAFASGTPTGIVGARVSAGDFDTSFGIGGKLTTVVPNAGWARSVVIQTDGKMIVGGICGFNVGPRLFCIIRYNQNGSLDSSFGNGGIVTSAIGGDGLNTLALQPDGKIIAGAPQAQSLLIARYLPSGVLDAAFGTAGVATHNLSAGLNIAHPGIAVRNDGRIIVAGSIREGTISVLLAIRLEANGALDPNFGVAGKATASFSPWTASGTAVILQPDNKIVLAGGAVDLSDATGTARDTVVARFDSNGSPDPSFAGGGKLRIVSPQSSDSSDAVVIQNDGKIVLGGQQRILNPSGPYSFGLTRLLSNGDVDPGFGTGGFVTTTLNPAESRISTLALQQNGKIVAIGTGAIIPWNAFAVVRYNTDGSPDMTFGTGGVVQHNMGLGGAYGFDGALQPDGKIVVVGISEDSNGPQFGLARYLGDAVVATVRSPFDFDGDGKTDVGIYRPAGGEWWYSRSGDGQVAAFQFGASTDNITPADYTGDGKTDAAFFRPATGGWYILRSEDSTYYALPFGSDGDVPVPADYDGDDKADVAVFRPSTSTWFVLQSAGGTRISTFGAAGDRPVPADYDADGRTDIGIFRPGAGEWWIDRSSAGLLALQFGSANDKPVQGDFTGDRKADIAFWRPSTGFWNVLRSEDFSYYAFPFGAGGDAPAPGDYDGDGRLDAAVFRANDSTWFIQRSTAGTQITQFGAAGDKPIPNAFVP